MKLQIAAYNDDTGTWSEVEEKALLSYDITHRFNEPAEATIILSDPTGLIARKYNVNAAGAVGGAVSDNGGVETDETTEANENTTNDMTLVPSPATVGDAYYIGLAKTFDSFILHVSKIYTGGNLNITWEYSTGADSWSALSDVIDETDDYEILGENRISWTVPSDWATDTVGAIADLYWVRGRVTTATAIILHPLGQQAWIGGVYVGPGKVTIEDPTGTDIFYGRIIKATANTGNRTLELYCQDWLSQLDEEQITYDMREDLDGSGLRQSEIHTVITEDKEPVYTSGANYYMFDGDMDWSIDEWNGKYLIFANEMAGDITVNTGPWEETVTGVIDSDLPADGEENVWSGMGTCHAMQDVPTSYFTVLYYFRMYVTEGTLGAANPDACYLDVDFKFASDDTGAYALVYIYNFGTTTWIQVGRFDANDEYQMRNLRAPANWPGGSDFADNCIDSNGKAQVRFRCYTGHADTDTLDFDVYTIRFEAKIATTGHTAAISITDTLRGHADGGATYNTLKVGTDLSITNLGLWEGCQYAIAKPVYLHIESATGPILGGDTMVTLTCGAANVENTSGISTRQYVGKTRLEIVKDIARQDKAHFWIPLGQPEDTPTVTYKSTFNDGSPETLTDTDLNSITSILDYSTLANEATAYGIRIGNERLSSTYTDTTSESKYNQTRTRITDDTGLVSEYDTLARATAIVNQYKDVQQILTATIRGNTAKTSHDKTLVLGDEVSITSAYLGLAAAVYIVQRFSYSSRNNLTTLLLHPRVSAIGLQKDERPSFDQVMQANRRGTADRYTAAPETNEVA